MRSASLLRIFLSIPAAAFAVLLSAAASPATAAGKVLPVTTQAQETSQWCWAASGQMLMNLIGADHRPPNVPQCYQANERFGRTDCCTCPTPVDCVKPGWPEFEKWNFTSTKTPTGTALTWSQLKGQIDGGKPFFFSWDWDGGGAHAMVVKGYYRFWWGPRMVVTVNPLPRQRRCNPGNASGPFGGDIEFITYENFVGGPGYGHTHKKDIYNITHD